MSEQLEDAWKEFERCGEISNAADGILDYASKLKEQNERMSKALLGLIKDIDESQSNGSICVCPDNLTGAKEILRQVRGE